MKINSHVLHVACRAGVFLASERSDFLREMFGRHLGVFRQSKVGERTHGGSVGDRACVQIRRLHCRLVLHEEHCKCCRILKDHFETLFLSYGNHHFK